MLKHVEISDPNSCWNRARPDERVFVLLERDIATPSAIRCRCQRRIMMGKNIWADEQIVEAMKCAELMEQDHAKSIKHI